MASTKIIKARIGSIKNIKKITETMEKISTVKIKKKYKQLNDSKEYYFGLMNLFSRIINSLKEKDFNYIFSHPFFNFYDLKNKNKNKSLIICITSNRGLCGAYNNNVFQTSKQIYLYLKNKNHDIEYYIIGKKGITFCNFNQLTVYKSIEIKDYISFEKVNEIIKDITNLFISNIYHKIYLVYTEYNSSGSQKAKKELFLPFQLKDFEKKIVNLNKKYKPLYLFEPNKDIIFNTILPKILEIKLFNSILQSSLSEQIFRRIAMKKASDSSSEIMNNLNIKYNQIRQNKITNELIEIMGAANAVKK